MNIDNMIKTLLVGACETVANDSVPSYLSSKYDREGAAINLGEAGSDDPRIMGALCKACLTDDEEDVRLASLESLEKLDRKIATTMSHCLLVDDDENVRELASSLVNEWGTH